MPPVERALFPSDAGKPMRPIFHFRDTAETATRVPVQDKRARRRQALFHEPLARRAQRVVFGLAFLIMPKRLRALPALIWEIASSMRRGRVAKPTEADIRNAPEGFSGVARDVTPATLLAAHRDGFFPLAHVGPLKWWTRNQRYVQILAERRIPKTLRNEMRKARLIVTFDQAFDTVIKACSEPRPGRPKLTWITPQIMHLYARLHDAGHAHSFEVWDEAGELVGGGYGVAVGRIFVTESLFSRTASASKMGMQALNYHLALWGYILNDVKDFAPHFASIGSRHLSRADYCAVLSEYGDASLPEQPRIVPWRNAASLAEIVTTTPVADSADNQTRASKPTKGAKPKRPPQVAPRSAPTGAPDNA
jgi:leucyl/phenylalanyl-tRNA---protein transferase